MRFAKPLPFIVGALSLLGAVANAAITDRPYDFTDAYYLANGVDPAKLGGRKQAPSASAVIDLPFFKYQRNVRVISTSVGYDGSGKPAFFTVMAGLGPDGFTNNSAGARARQIAEKYVEYVFPKIGGDPVGLGGARQSVILDTRNGYFSGDPLGLWLHVWVSFTQKAFNTRDGQKALDDLAKKHGISLDGTPIIATASEIDNLYSKGFIAKRTRTDSLRYAVCPVIKDPRDGGIAPDAFLNYTKFPDGTPLEPQFLRAFNNLQQTGDWGDINP
jgi:hypothetical protein